MPIALARSLALAALGIVAACGLKVRAAQTGGLTQASLDGEWTGTWAPADGGTGGGPLTVRLQRFDGEPVVGINISNPCIVPRVYDLVLQANAIQLKADGAVVFGAQLDGQESLLGTWQCSAGNGAWNATRTRALPTVPDLSGTWTGAVVVSASVAFAVELQLDQSVRGGLLAVDGSVHLPELLLDPIAVSGSLAVGDTTFDLVLDSAAGAPVRFTVAGSGDVATARLNAGFVQFLAPNPLPISQGLLHIERTGP